MTSLKSHVPKCKGYWKGCEKANIKDYRKIWEIAREIVQKKGVPFEVNKRGRPPKLELWMYPCLAILYAYFTPTPT